MVLLFEKHRVLDLNSLKNCLQRSRASVFRDLGKLGYLSSYTHSGRYFTLKNIADFNSLGLWYHNHIGFSKHGNLKNTLTVLIENSEDGKTHSELENLLQIRAHNSLLNLVNQGLVSRQRWNNLYLYLSAMEEKAKRQLNCRQQQTIYKSKPPSLNSQIVILVLLEILHSSERRPNYISSRLKSQGIQVTNKEVEDIFLHYNLGKKN